MPKVSYNDPKVSKLYGGFTKTVKLTAKGQKIQFVLGTEFPVMFGIHWIDRKPFACPRVNHEKDCPRCQEGFALLKELSEKKLDKDSKEYKELHKKAMDKLPTITYSYPVFVTGGSYDRGAYILDATKTSYDRFGDLKEKGNDLLETHWELERTEKPGNYYPLDVTKLEANLTAEEIDELAQVAETDIESSKSCSSILEFYGTREEGFKTPESLDDFIAEGERKAKEEEKDAVVAPF